MHSPEAKILNAISLDAAPFTDDMVHQSARHALDQRRKCARWLDEDDELMVANAMLIILGRALNMLKSQIEAQGAAFEPTGGFSERLMTKRLEAREKSREPSPECPQCAPPLRPVKSRKGSSGVAPRFPNAREPSRSEKREREFIGRRSVPPQTAVAGSARVWWERAWRARSSWMA